MNLCLITGSGGLVGSEAVRFFADKFDSIYGVDNNMRGAMFGNDGSVNENIESLKHIKNYQHINCDYREFIPFSQDFKLIIHCAAQPSHDYASNHAIFDFDINATGTVRLLEQYRNLCPEAVFIFMSTNKVYGDIVNRHSYQELNKRILLDWFEVVNEAMPIDQSMHSIYGASKLAADIMVQEYGKYYGLKTVCFRAGCISGASHAGVEAHGFLNYLMKCAIQKKKYKIFGYGGKQVRDNIHAFDLVTAFWQFYQNPKHGEVYNIGGGLESNCSILEAIEMCEEITTNKMDIEFIDEPRKGDHKWWISDSSKFREDYPQWKLTYNVRDILTQIHERNK